MPSEKVTAVFETKGKARFKRDMKEAQGSVKTASTSMAGSLKGIGTAAVAFLSIQTVRAVFSGIKSLVEFGEQAKVIETSFKRLAKSIGQSSEQMMMGMRRGTQGLVNDFSLMRHANQAILLGIPATAKQMEEMADVSLRLGRAVGRTANESMADLITGFGRQSAMILDNLGITIKAEEAYEEFAGKIGKTADELTDAEKKLAFFTIGMEKARVKAEALGDVVGGIAEKAQRVKTDWQNAGSVIGQAFGRGLDRAFAQESLVGRLMSVTGNPLVKWIASLDVPNDNDSALERAVARQAELAGELTTIQAQIADSLSRDLPSFGEFPGMGEARLEALKEELKHTQEILEIQGDLVDREKEKIRLAALDKRFKEAMAKLDRENEAHLERVIALMGDPAMERIANLQAPGSFTGRGFEPRDMGAGRIERFDNKVGFRRETPEEMNLRRMRESMEEVKEDAVKMGEVFDDIPATFEEKFGEAFQNISQGMSLLGMETNGIFGGLRSGLLGFRGLQGIAKKPSAERGLGDLLAGAGFAGQIAAGFAPAVQAISGFFAKREPGTGSQGLLPEEELSAAEAAFLESVVHDLGILQDAKKTNTPLGQLGVRLTGGATIDEAIEAKQELVRKLREKAAGGVVDGTSGSQQFSSVASITEKSANLLVGTLETMRTQDATRNRILTTLDRKLGNIEFHTAISSGAGLLRFAN